MKMGSGARKSSTFSSEPCTWLAAPVPVARPPRQLPASTGVIYYQIEPRSRVLEKEVARIVQPWRSA